MRLKGFVISVIITLILILVLDRHWGQIPPLAKFFSPQQGFWCNAEPVDQDFSGHLQVNGLRGPVKVWLDERLVPHIFAQNDRDVYYVQGYMTAMFRLWQMELQVRAAAGRLSEVVGRKALDYDRLQRRKGMVTAAENSLAVMQEDTDTKEMLDAYTAGVNAYIGTLAYKDLPVEFKLLDYKPEAWNNLKSALLLKYMSDVLTGYTNDLENTNALKSFTRSQFNQLFPDFPDSLYPIIPRGTAFYKPSVTLPATLPDSGRISIRDTVNIRQIKPDKDNGSNNWVVSGKKTRSGVPILCNDPHLGLNLPSLWYEVQLQGPGMNVYGASLPGAPGVIIGFNHFIAWGVTNAQRDVKDYYAIKFKDPSMKEYWYNNAWERDSLKIEKIGIRGSKPFIDTVAYTVFGPVTYDPSFPDTLTQQPYLAVHWAALDSSNEMKTFYLLDHARGFNDFKSALQYFECPGQNFAFADVTGNIAIWQQGRFPLREKDGGKFILPGDDSAYLWHQYIPFLENPHILDPAQNYLYSANQNPTDTTYPYHYSGDFIQFRARRIAHVLADKNDLTVQDMMKLQNDYYDGFAAEALPLMLRFLDTGHLNAAKEIFLDSLKQWNYQETAESINPILFSAWWDSLYANIWEDDIQSGQRMPLPSPTDNTTIEWLLRDSAMPYIDNRNTPQKENLRQVDGDAFLKSMDAVQKMDTSGNRTWGRYRGTDIMHLAKIPAFSRMHLYTGGTSYTVNAIKKDHGPSWRMIVQMSDPVEAYVVYPGGQSGNPGSRYYDDFIGDWVQGRYYKAHVFSPSDSTSREVRYRIVFSSLKK